MRIFIHKVLILNVLNFHKAMLSNKISSNNKHKSTSLPKSDSLQNFSDFHSSLPKISRDCVSPPFTQTSFVREDHD